MTPHIRTLTNTKNARKNLWHADLHSCQRWTYSHLVRYYCIMDVITFPNKFNWGTNIIVVSVSWCMDWWQYPQLILPQQIPAPEPTSLGLSVAILRLTSIPSFREPFLLGTSFQQKPPKLRSSMHSSIVFRSSAFHLHRRDIPSGSLPFTFQIQIESISYQCGIELKSQYWPNTW